MGASTLAGFIECVEGGLIGARQALYWHFTVNCYPPQPVEMIDPLIHALLLVAADRPDHEVPLPEGVTHRRYGTAVPASAMVDSFHAWQFLELVEGRVEFTGNFQGFLGDGDEPDGD